MGHPYSSRASSRRQTLALLQLGEQGIDLLLALERVEAAFDVVAEQFGTRFTNRLFALDLVAHAVEGGILARRRELRLGCAAGGARAAMLRDQQVHLRTCFRELDFQLLQRGFE